MSTKRIRLVEIVLLVVAVLYLFPLYLILTNSVKSFNEILSTPLSFPTSLHFNNYSETWVLMDYLQKLGNSLIVTLFPIPFIIVFSAMASYILARTKTRLSTSLFYLFMSSMLIPFQVIMFPLVRLSRQLHLNNSLFGLDLIYIGFSISFAIFLYHGFVKGIPIELEDAAKIDGCSQFQTFYRIIFPLLLPITSVLMILNVLAIWNDFFLPLVLLNDEKLQTLPLAAYTFVGKYMKDWTKQLPATVLVGAPMTVFFLIFQRYIIGGITSGAVKG